MKKIILPATMIAILLAGFVSCGQKSKSDKQDNTIVTVHNSMISLDWMGTYTGVTSSDDCERINISITLNPDGTYDASYLCFSKDDNILEYFSGNFSWNESGGVITLEDSKKIHPHYKVGENKLIQLDTEGNPIADGYVLEKEVEWSLSE